MTTLQKQEKAIRELCLNLTEVLNQADADLCGAPREFHLPRLRKAYAAVLTLFPVAAARAMEEAKDAYGRLLIEDELEDLKKEQ